MSMLKATYIRYNNMKHLKTFEVKSETFDLDFDVNAKHEEEENEMSTTAPLLDALIECVDINQQALNMYAENKDLNKLLKINEAATEAAQTCINFLNREYGPIEEVKKSSKSIMEQCIKDFKEYQNVDLVMECISKCKRCVELL